AGRGNTAQLRVTDAGREALALARRRTARTELDTALDADGLSLRIVGALGHLAASPDLSVSDLARRAGVSAPSMLATVRRLEERGHVQRLGPAGRGNTAQLRVTDAGREALALARRRADELDGTLFGALPPADRAALLALLGRAAASLLRR
ncbi:MarR family winged helix-turn-helix transcriptional regulator, partial [Streptomyces bohaiensis]|uniref:MarR family winged helix-turn-helix transcriptional regulator n=1 Tax=Streptomyces bohaiensis TaxID=1431344 RepID=UPI0030C772A9